GAQPLEVDSGAGWAKILEREQGLREQVDRRLASAAFEAQMERRGGSAGCAERMLEALGRLEVVAAIEGRDRQVEFAVHRNFLRGIFWRILGRISFCEIICGI